MRIFNRYRILMTLNTMEENLDLRKALVDARLAVKDLPRTGNGDTIEAYWEVCCGDVLVAEENLREQRRLWENSALAEEFLDIAEYLEGFDHKLDGLNQAVQRMTDAVYEHPALKLRLLMFRQLVLSRIESLHGCELGASEDVHAQICLYERNIEHADNGEYDLVEQEGHLKRDPVEWSSAYEKVIDEVERLVDEELEDHPRGMGFCFAYWSAKKHILLDRFGIEWRSPSEMNPGVMFD